MLDLINWLNKDLDFLAKRPCFAIIANNTLFSVRSNVIFIRIKRMVSGRCP
jgi:hypothetical protein